MFANVTMLTIAYVNVFNSTLLGPDNRIRHRLNTILESDRILVLDQGQVAEFDTPQKLLEDKQSIFFSMAAEAGIAHA